MPTLLVVESCMMMQAPKTEQWWIEHFRREGTLFNTEARNATMLHRKRSWRHPDVEWLQ
jgi:hypothetical protein